MSISVKSSFLSADMLAEHCQVFSLLHRADRDGQPLSEEFMRDVIKDWVTKKRFGE